MKGNHITSHIREQQKKYNYRKDSMTELIIFLVANKLFSNSRCEEQLMLYIHTHIYVIYLPFIFLYKLNCLFIHKKSTHER